MVPQWSQSNQNSDNPNFSHPPHHATYSEVAQHKLRDSHGRFASDYLPQDPASQNINPPPFWTKIMDYIVQYLKKLSFKKVLAIASFISLLATNGPLQNIIEQFFPYSSPILHRQVAHQGILQISGNGSYALFLPDKSVYSLYFKPSSTLTNLKKISEVVVKGNLTWTPYVIENAEVYPISITSP